MEVQRGRVVSLGHSGGGAEEGGRTHRRMGVHVPERWTVRLTDRRSNKQREECGGQALKTRNPGQVACLLLPLPAARPSGAQLCPHPQPSRPLGPHLPPTTLSVLCASAWSSLILLNPLPLLPSLCLLTKSQTQGRGCPQWAQLLLNDLADPKALQGSETSTPCRLASLGRDAGARERGSGLLGGAPTQPCRGTFSLHFRLHSCSRKPVWVVET